MLRSQWVVGTVCWRYSMVAFGVLLCFILIVIVMSMIIIMIFFIIIIIVIITQPLAGHFADRVSQPLFFTWAATYRSPSQLLTHSHRIATTQLVAGHWAFLRSITCGHLVCKHVSVHTA